MAKNKFYTVQRGWQPGVYTSWAACKKQVDGYSGAKFKGFPTKQEAEYALVHGWESNSKAKTPIRPSLGGESPSDDYIKESISVDAACSGNPGEMEYQGVDTATGEVLFRSDVYPVGTNNIGEFLAVVKALQYLQERQSDIPIYSDSISAIAWVRNQWVRSKLDHPGAKKLWSDIYAAVQWLKDNDYNNPVLKWETKQWGEIKADFGRK